MAVILAIIGKNLPRDSEYERQITQYWPCPVGIDAYARRGGDRSSAGISRFVGGFGGLPPWDVPNTLNRGGASSKINLG